jgi:KH domain
MANLCLHCCKSNEVQLACDSCDAFVCVECHWCHEFQANHEIRVCDTCNSFLCKKCEVMEQCHDCGKVICKSCGALLICKFCGAALCEECAKACAKCGIVLCGRDAKFAVDCDTCKLSYCLVCLASGPKETCVRCNARPSKRMEQLVHLRLKSIYKAFQHSSRENDNQRHLKRQATTLVKCKDQKKEIDPIKANAKAELAAAELLAEIEQEQEESKKTSKKKGKKKKKGKDSVPAEASSDVHGTHTPIIQNASSKACVSEDQIGTQKIASDVQSIQLDEDFRKVLDKKQLGDTEITASNSISRTNSSIDNKDSNSLEKEIMQEQLVRLVNQEDTNGIEKMLETLKGIPGKGNLRKNAKKALKRLKDKEDPQSCLRIVTTKEKSAATSETVFEIDSSTVGLLIGKGGQKIRGLMDQSGAKIWIDQESMEPHHPRTVYVSGAKTSVAVALNMIQEIVKDNQSKEGASFSNAVHGHTVGKISQLKNATTEEFNEFITAEIPCDSCLVPLLIGSRGWNIKQIQDISGSKVDIDQSVIPCLIQVSGTLHAVQHAKNLINEVLHNPSSQPKTGTEGIEIFSDNGFLIDSPSGYVMTVDVKSVVSASSSLSSTPEPSMASSKGRDVLMPPPGFKEHTKILDVNPWVDSIYNSLNSPMKDPVVHHTYGDVITQAHCLSSKRMNEQIALESHDNLTYRPDIHHHASCQMIEIRKQSQNEVTYPSPPHIQYSYQRTNDQIDTMLFQSSVCMKPALTSTNAMLMNHDFGMEREVETVGLMAPNENLNHFDAEAHDEAFAESYLLPYVSTIEKHSECHKVSYLGGPESTKIQHQAEVNSALPHFHCESSHNRQPLALSTIGKSHESHIHDPLPYFPPTPQQNNPFMGVEKDITSQEESDLIDRMFAPNQLRSNNSNLSTEMKRLKVGSPCWEDSNGILDWGQYEDKHIFSTPVEFRFPWEP